MCYMQLTEIEDAKNRHKFAIWTPSHNFVKLYLCNYKKAKYRSSIVYGRPA